VKVRRVESLRPGVTLSIEGAAGHLEGWREFLTLGEGAQAQLRSTDSQIVLARGARAFYLAGRPDDVLLEAVLRRVLACAGLATLDLPLDIRVRDNGPTRFVFNYGDTIVDISSIIGDAPLYLGERRLPPCGVAAFTASTD
jgi:beta-galactosidase